MTSFQLGSTDSWSQLESRKTGWKREVYETFMRFHTEQTLRLIFSGATRLSFFKLEIWLPGSPIIVPRRTNELTLTRIEQ